MIWQAFNNQYWPAHYFIDGKGRIRHHHFGEGDYERSEQVIQQLLRENGATSLSGVAINVSATGAEAAPDNQDVRSHETYIGYQRAEHFASAEPIAQDASKSLCPASTALPQSVGLERNLEGGVRKARCFKRPPGKLCFAFMRAICTWC